MSIIIVKVCVFIDIFTIIHFIHINSRAEFIAKFHKFRRVDIFGQCAIRKLFHRVIFRGEHILFNEDVLKRHN